ncbi:hypothetical protein NKL07_00275 [Mesorhizobium sp. C280B]|uniref:hypothetical protein n=1 Tax=unclassified Mesorhizobium TaxID=325217 RepID=UPI0012EB0590|nr:hypothetical protein [Mesorhizobium sp. LSJC280B00]
MNQVMCVCSHQRFVGLRYSPSRHQAHAGFVRVYAGKSCSQLEAELYRTSSDLAPIMAIQDRTARHDVDGVFWLGLPVGSMMDNTDIKVREAKIGELKGNMDAINAARRKGGCVAGTL